jgi:hypothetical protein
MWYKNKISFLIILTFLITHLLIINDYGLTWDFHHHFFAGLHKLGITLSTPELRGDGLPFTEPDPRKTFDLPFGPIMSISPIFTFIIFYQKLHILSFDDAYNLSSILWGVAGIGIVYAFMREALNSRVALFSTLFLGLLPRFFGDLHNNMKDIPEAVIFALNIWFLWRLVKHRRLTDLLLASLAFAIAFNVKVNSIFIPIIFLIWIFFIHVIPGLTRDPSFQNSGFRLGGRNDNRLYYFLLAPLFAFILWSVFWQHPITQLLYIPSFFRDNTQNIEVILFGKWYCSGVNVPWYYPLVYLGITTPIPVLVFFLTGIGMFLYSFFSHMFIVHRSQITEKPTVNSELYTFLLIWFFLPIARYIFPQMGVIDGVRHFEEVLPALAVIAAVGFEFVLKRMRHIGRISLICLICMFLLYPIISSHPYQITYFNELVGGTRGALGKFDLDYWGTSQKQAVEWVNKNAPQHAKIYIVMASDVAGRYLRPDLLANLSSTNFSNADYVILLNRQGFLYRYFYAYDFLLHHKPIHTVSTQGVPLTWIFAGQQTNVTEPQTPYWQGTDPCIRKYW